MINILNAPHTEAIRSNFKPWVCQSTLDADLHLGSPNVTRQVDIDLQECRRRIVPESHLRRLQFRNLPHARDGHNEH